MTVLTVILGVAAVVFAVLWLQYRDRLYRATDRIKRSPIPVVKLDQFDAVFVQDEHGPTRDAEVTFIGTGRGVVGGTSDREAWILAVLAKHAHVIFEFGTATGKSTYLMARNSPADTRLITITLPPDAVATYTHAAGDAASAHNEAMKESLFTTFLYTGTDVAHKVDQLFGDSKSFNAEPYRGQCDLIFVDGSHAYSYVVSDTRKALEMLAPNGTILWHDYRGRYNNPDVYRALNELHRKLPLVRLAETSLIAYRSAGARIEDPWRG